jgi:hypothetical protein
MASSASAFQSAAQAEDANITKAVITERMIFMR